MSKLKLIFLLIFIIFTKFTNTQEVPIKHIFPNRGPISGNTRVIIYSKLFTQVSSGVYQSPKVIQN